MPTDSPPCWLCTSTTRPGIPSSSPVISTHDAAAIFLPSRLARSSTRCKSSAEIEVLAEPITPILIGGLCMVLSSRTRGVRRICPRCVPIPIVVLSCIGDRPALLEHGQHLPGQHVHRWEDLRHIARVAGDDEH